MLIGTFKSLLELQKSYLEFKTLSFSSKHSFLIYFLIQNTLKVFENSIVKFYMLKIT